MVYYAFVMADFVFRMVHLVFVPEIQKVFPYLLHYKFGDFVLAVGVFVFRLGEFVFRVGEFVFLMGEFVFPMGDFLFRVAYSFFYTGDFKIFSYLLHYKFGDFVFRLGDFVFRLVDFVFRLGDLLFCTGDLEKVTLSFTL